jgi:hypothetical protein
MLISEVTLKIIKINRNRRSTASKDLKLLIEITKQL